MRENSSWRTDVTENLDVVNGDELNGASPVS
jgi:hypothetical protein